MKKTTDGLIKLAMFIVTFDREKDMKRNYDIHEIYYLKIRTFRSDKLISQCEKCKRYGHQKNIAELMKYV